MRMERTIRWERLHTHCFANCVSKTLAVRMADTILGICATESSNLIWKLESRGTQIHNQIREIDRRVWLCGLTKES